LDSAPKYCEPLGGAVWIAEPPAQQAYTVEQKHTPRIAVIIPCRNEQVAIKGVVQAFKESLPSADIYVFDNASTDETAAYAKAAGATVIPVRAPGKGQVVRRMFADVDADIYVMTDGDMTYDAQQAPAMVALLRKDRLDMVVGRRVSTDAASYRQGHKFGNYVLTKLVAVMFEPLFDDMLSGYRVFSRRFVKSFPAESRGFEIETELTVHALSLRLPVAEVDTVYVSRPAGSASKLNTYRDGVRILIMILNLLRFEKPILFFGLFALLAVGFSLSIFASIYLDFLHTGIVPKIPTLVVISALGVSGLVSLVCGIILDAASLMRREARRLAYLMHPALAPLPMDEASE
jgi:glycosyltransferase involved in cell wall biosynthesis